MGTINPVIEVMRPGEVPRFGKPRCVRRVEAITVVRSTEPWVLERVMQLELTNVRTVHA
jgi:hypothetical protein